MGEAHLEGEAVDEGLQRRAGRADGAAHVEEAAARRVEPVGGADAGEDGAAAVVGDDEGGAMPGRAPRARSATSASRLAWSGASRVVAIPAAPGWAAARRSARWGARAGKGRRAVGTGSRAGGGGLLGGEDAGGGGAGEDAVAGGAGGLGRAVGAAGLGGLRERDEEGGLGGGEAAGLLAEPGEARGAHALEVAAVGGEGEVEPEDRVLVEAALEGEGDAHLAELAAEGAGRAFLEEAGDLHGEGRAAGDDAAGGERPEAARARARGSTPGWRRKRRSSKAVSWAR